MRRYSSPNFVTKRPRLSIAIGLILLSALALAPSTFAGILPLSGVVTDTIGRPLNNVTLELRNPNGGAVAHATSNAAGHFEIAPAKPGMYSLVAVKPGFKSGNKIVRFPHGAAQNVMLTLDAESALSVPVQASVLRSPNGVSSTGANRYTMSATDIASTPRGENADITDVLAQMPGVAIDQNQQIHIRNTEGPQFQYQINGVMVPLDINTNPPFVSMLNPVFIKQMTLLDGVLPSRYSYATGGVLNIQTKDGCEAPGGSATMYGGQRDTVQPSFQYGGCAGNFSYYVNGLYSMSNSAFSSATPAPDAIHNSTIGGQGFGYLTYDLNPMTRLSLTTSVSASNNELPNQSNLTPAYDLAGVGNCPSADINSYLNFRDYLGILALNAAPTSQVSYQLAYSAHYISQSFNPDNVGELIYQGVSSTAFHSDLDNTFEGDVTYKVGAHTLGAGGYLGEYGVEADDNSLVFKTPVTSPAVPVRVINNSNKINLLSGIYLEDTWQITEKLRANVGIRWDRLSGYTYNYQFDPTINFIYALRPQTSLHAGFARYMQVPSFQGISPGAPQAFKGTTGEAGNGVVTPTTEDDYEGDIGIVHQLTRQIGLSEDAFYEYADHYLDTGQFGNVPIFAPFNYRHGYIWGTESALTYQGEHLSAHVSTTIGRNMQNGVATGQFNFDPDELGYINRHYIVLDHQPLYGAAAGASYRMKPWLFSVEGIYSSGLRGGFADTETLPNVVQIDLAAQRAFHVPSFGDITNRITLLNIFDRTNLIRPAEGIGIFQAAYGPRITVYDALTIPLPPMRK